MKSLLLALLMTLAATFSASAAPDDGRALASAQEWLALVDSGKYAESWTRASSLFRSRVDQKTWATQIKSVRDEFGPLNNRRVQKVDLVKSFPGVPDGDYAVVTFQTDFANKHQAIETVAMKLEKDQWLEAGYFIR